MYKTDNQKLKQCEILQIQNFKPKIQSWQDSGVQTPLFLVLPTLTKIPILKNYPQVTQTI